MKSVGRIFGCIGPTRLVSDPAKAESHFAGSGRGGLAWCFGDSRGASVRVEDVQSLVSFAQRPRA